MDIEIGPGDASDAEIGDLLNEAYVEDGHTSRAGAESVFAPGAVRARGMLLCARDGVGMLRGMVVVVEAGSVAARLAQDGEVEMHLLAVSKASRGRGIGRALVEASIEEARRRGASRMLLWTQPRMVAAQALYRSSGFVRLPEKDFSRSDRAFLVFQRTLRSASDG